MKAIFLDVDYVLRPGIFGRFDKNAVDNVNEIINRTKANIVVSSTWRYGGLHIIQGMFARNGIKPDHIIGITVRDPLENRGEQIDKFIKKNGQITKYVIIDNNDRIFSDQQLKHFVVIEKKAGLTKEGVEKAIRLLQD